MFFINTNDNSGRLQTGRFSAVLGVFARFKNFCYFLPTRPPASPCDSFSKSRLRLLAGGEPRSRPGTLRLSGVALRSQPAPAVCVRFFRKNFPVKLRKLRQRAGLSASRSRAVRATDVVPKARKLLQSSLLFAE